MPRINVYLPDDLAARARDADLNMSALLQDAVRRTLAAAATDAWLDSLPAPPSTPVRHDDVVAALDAARNEAEDRLPPRG